jgi:hypothetical protein
VTEEPLIVSVGAEVDVQALTAEIKAEVARKIAEGVYPPELLEELRQASDPLAGALNALADSGVFSVDAPVESGRSLKGRLVTNAKRTIRKAARWYAISLAGQLETFAANTSTVANLLAGRQRELEREVQKLREELTELREGDRKSSRRRG